MFAHHANDQCLDLCGRYPVELGRFVRLALHESSGDVIAVAHTIFDGIRRRHAVAALVEDTAHQE